MDSLIYRVDGAVARITLNRPDKGNAIDAGLARALLAAAVRAEEDAAVRAVLLDAAGNNFCFGGDLKSFHGEGDGVAALLKTVTIDFHGAVSRLLRMAKPVVVAVNGVAAGGGMSLSLIGDVVLAGAGASFTMAYTAAGLSPDGGSSYMLPRLVGLRRAQELMLTNRRLTAAEAVDWGLITRAVPDAELGAEAEALAAGLATGATRAFGTVKRLLADTFATGLENQMMAESEGISRNADGADGREGIQAFVDKRKPAYTGA